MSRGSRFRLSKFFAGLDWEYYAQRGTPYKHVTLSTGPEFWGRELHTYKSLRRFLRWLKSQSGYVGHVVRRERGSRRGMMHYHVLVWGPRWVPAGEIRGAWRRALRAERTQRVHIEDVPGERVFRYLTKYVSKAAYGRAEGVRRVGAAGAGAVRLEAPSPRDVAAEVGGGVLSLSELHNSTDGSVGDVNELGFDKSCEGFTGHRWWYWGGDLRRAERVYLRSVDAASIAAHVRRIYRKVLRARRLKRVLDRGGSWDDARRDAKKWERTRAGGYWSRGLSGRGFVVMASPALLSKCVQSAISRRDSSVEECMGDEVGLRELDLIQARREYRDAHSMLSPFGVSPEGRSVVWGTTRYQDAARVLSLLGESV